MIGARDNWGVGLLVAIYALSQRIAKTHPDAGANDEIASPGEKRGIPIAERGQDASGQNANCYRVEVSLVCNDE
jgi:hypothetical protein